MKLNSTIVGLLIGLIGGLLVHAINTSSPEISNTIVSVLAIAIVVCLRINYYRKQSKRDEQLVANGMNHYRQFHHHRRLIKKTS